MAIEDHFPSTMAGKLSPIKVDLIGGGSQLTLGFKDNEDVTLSRTYAVMDSLVDAKTKALEERDRVIKILKERGYEIVDLL